MDSNTRIIHYVAAASIGLLMAVLPHLVQLYHSNTLLWIADFDELGLYLPIAAKALFNDPWVISDPLFQEVRATMFPAMQFLPATVSAWIFGLGPEYLGFIWRIIGGLVSGLAWFVLLRTLLGSAKIGLLATAALLCDGGLLMGQPFVHQAWRFIQDVLGMDIWASHLKLHPQWRIITPALSLWLYVVYLDRTYRALISHERRDQFIAGLMFASLFYMYFYYWTAAGLALLLGILFSKDSRKDCFLIGVIGTIGGLPALIQSYLLKRGADETWLWRSDKFVSIDNFSELMLPKVAIAIFVVWLFWGWKRQPNLRVIALHGIAALLLANHQVLSGLQIENFHWNYVWGPVAALLFVAAIIPVIRKHVAPKWHWGLLTLLLLHVGLGVYYRSLEGTMAVDWRTIEARWKRFSPVFTAWSEEFRSAPNAVIGGDRMFTQFAIVKANLRPVDSYFVLLSRWVDFSEWQERNALNAWLEGLSKEEYMARTEERIRGSKWGPWGRDRLQAQELLAARGVAYSYISAAPEAVLQKYQVKYIVQPLDRPTKNLEFLPGIELVDQAGHWRLWRLDSMGVTQ